MSDPQNPDVPTPPPGYGQTPPPSSAPTPPPAYGAAPLAAQPTYSSAPPAPYGAPASPTVPGKTLGIVAFILAFFIQLVALILGIVALVQSRRAGHKNGWALAAIILSAVLMVLGLIIGLVVVVPLITFAQETVQACSEVGFEGTVVVRGVEVACNSSMR